MFIERPRRAFAALILAGVTYAGCDAAGTNPTPDARPRDVGAGVTGDAGPDRGDAPVPAADSGDLAPAGGARDGTVGDGATASDAGSLADGGDASAPVCPVDPRSPPPGPESTMYILPLYEGIRFASDVVVGQQMDRLIAQVGKGNRYHKTGFASILPPEAKLLANCKQAVARGLSLGVIFGGFTHDRPDLTARWNGDLRVYQWRKNGVNWQGYYTGANPGGGLEIPADTRDHLVPTPSRYADLVQGTLLGETRRDARAVKNVMNAVPGCLAVLNGVIEEEYAVAASSQSDDYLSDYSPFSVTEFRDWLRHAGKYDAAGAFAGQGAPVAITGAAVFVGGQARSPFYDDPSPADAHGTGKSFNETFGTTFTTWTLRYWDLAAFPAPITDPAFDPSPESGPGFTAGGFDAPRVRDASPYWTAWSWDYDDRGGKYPPGNPTAPAWGFRQTAIHHWVTDQFDVMVAEGLPKELMFPHQIPGERIGSFNGGASRCRSSASTVWTGYLPMNGNVGVTLFNGPIDYASIAQYTDLVPSSRNWGIFEWHPLPGIAPGDQRLYDTSMHHLTTYYAQNVHYLFPGWWQETGQDATFPLNDSKLAQAIKDFLASRPDKPYPGYHCP